MLIFKYIVIDYLLWMIIIIKRKTQLCTSHKTKRNSITTSVWSVPLQRGVDKAEQPPLLNLEPEPLGISVSKQSLRECELQIPNTLQYEEDHQE